MRKLLFFLFTALLPALQMAADESYTDSQNIVYTLTSTTGEDETTTYTATVSSGTNATGDITIPATVTYTNDNNTYTVTSVAESAFKDCTSLTSIIFPSTITYIGGSAFEGCTKLATITVNSASAPECADAAFEDIASSVTLNIPFSWNDQATTNNWRSSEANNDYGGWASLLRASNPTIKRFCTISDLGYATLCSSSAVTAPSGVTAYIASSTGLSTVVCTAITDGIIPKSTGVFLKATAGTYYFTETSTTTTYSTNKFLGTLEATTVSGGSSSTIYVLSNVSNAAAFCKYTGTTMPANKAYLSMSSSSAKDFSIVFNDGNDETTGIVTVSTTTTKANGAIYNLQGQRVSSPVRGNIYIQNGRKFIAK